MRDAQQLDLKLRGVFTPLNSISYIFKNYDLYKSKASDLSLYHGLNFRKIVDGILKAEGLRLEDNDPVFIDKDYLKGLGTILATAHKRYVLFFYSSSLLLSLINLYL